MLPVEDLGLLMDDVEEVGGIVSTGKELYALGADCGGDVFGFVLWFREVVFRDLSVRRASEKVC